MRLLAYLKPYWAIFIVSTLGLWLFGAMEIAAVDMLGYLIDVLTLVTGEKVDITGINVDKVDTGLTAWVAQS